ncbi:hypothetical protein [Flavobacterium haoranii]|uniref:VWA domain-containing protein n=1 Tax=Flavobacterium haoranii TaxID=683124 RepID=A0A1M6HLT4_9FLAO|nr:hypothetical protein [Flavobacterium haoranii]SHJ23156.1 hypothetical protein SAMN05444337_1584 [Flavobacterium haoranii]
MTATTLLLLILSVLVAGGLAYLQYFFKAKSNSKWNLLLAFLRFLSILGILILLINPLVKIKKYEIEKLPLPIFIDNSKSIQHLGVNNEAKNVLKEFQKNADLENKFNVQFFSFDAEIKKLDSLNFKGNQTLLNKIPKELKQLYRNKNYPIVAVTDGNQTFGEDYVFDFQENNPVFPVVLGDTVKVFDSKISAINVNQYAFLKNKFPVEVFIESNSKESFSSVLSISNGNVIVARQNVQFSKNQLSQKVSFLLDASTVGIKKFHVFLQPKESEKNKINNSKPFVIDVIDQRTEIALIASINHPDLGVLKRSIEANEQRKVSIVKPIEVDLKKYSALVLYQPNQSFRNILEQNKVLKINSLLITGKTTDFDFLNNYVDDFSFRMSNQFENFTASFNSNFTNFSIENFGFERFSPLENKFGSITTKGDVSVLLKAKVKNVEITAPLVSFSEIGSKRSAYIFGEGIWKWRMESYLKDKSFDDFDNFIDKIVQYLSVNPNKKALLVEAEKIYNTGLPIEIKAQYFDKNFEFDPNAELSITLTKQKDKKTKSYNFYNSSNEYLVNFDNLEAGFYSYTVSEKKSKERVTGIFEVIAFDIENQFVNPDLRRLEQLAQNTSGKVYYPNNVTVLINSLLKDESLNPTQKEVVRKSPLIDWKWLLLFIVSLLSLEWFIRKYNGLT